MDRVPAEIMLHVASFLNFPTDYQNFSLVNKFSFECLSSDFAIKTIFKKAKIMEVVNRIIETFKVDLTPLNAVPFVDNAKLGSHIAYRSDQIFHHGILDYDENGVLSLFSLFFCLQMNLCILFSESLYHSFIWRW